MIKKVSLFSFLLLFTFSGYACELPKGEVIKVGCSYDCDFFYRFRLTMTAWMMGYSTQITNLQEKPDMKIAMSEVDGILLPGGADINPKFYMDNVSPKLREYTRKNLGLVNFSEEGALRDPFEYSLVKLYSTDESFKNLPMLGICRGLQMMSVAQGIPLYLDIKTELGIRNRYNRFDRIYTDQEENSLMKTLYRPKVRGFKFHHQGIRVPYYKQNISKYPKTRVTAFSHNRRIAEAIEYTHRPALGVQFHPERSFPRASVPVFKWFLTKACEHKNSSTKALK